MSFQAQQFGRYYLVDRIAVGGMAEVFKARTFSDGGFQKLLVIKRILQHLGGNEEFIEMFIDEAKISVELQHPNIVQIYDFGRIGEEYFLAMECVEGKDVKGILRKMAERRRVLPPEFAAFVAIEMCKGLDFAHKKMNLHGEHMGIVHRDISPSNILVSYNGEVKIADFGIAKAENSLYNTKDGVLKGKFEYMSPEQASGEKVSHLSDIFATGIILHEMLTGRRLFKTDSDIRTLNKIKAVDIEPPSATNPNVPARLDEIVMKALSQDPAARFADGRAMQTALLEFIYPSTPDVVHESFKRFIRELFAEEIDAERTRLQEGSKVAEQMWNQDPGLELEPEWEEPASTAHTIQTAPKRSLALPIAGGLVVLAALGTALFFATRPPEVIEAPPIEAAPQLGSIQLRIEPADLPVRVLLGGREVGQGSGTVLIPDVVPGADLPLRVEAEGYAPHEETIDLVGNERLRLPLTLQSLTDPSPPPPVEARPGEVEAPAPGRGAAPPTVETPPRRGQKAPPVETPAAAGRDPAAAPAGPGKVNVNIRGGWANVFIDGRQIDQTPLVGFEIPAGTHSIRVVNEAAGVDETKTITVTAGELSKVVF